MSFELSREQCQGMTLTAFIVHFEGLPTYKHNVTTLDVENESINLTLPLNATMLNVCSLNGVIFGSNDVGNSSTEGIKLPNGKTCWIVVVHAFLVISSHFNEYKGELLSWIV